MGRKSTRKVPGIIAKSTAAIASSDAEKNLSFSDSTFTPYAIDKAKDPEKLLGQTTRGEPGILQRLDGTDVQIYMLQEAFGRLGEPTKEDVHCPVDPVIELVHGRNIEKTVK